MYITLDFYVDVIPVMACVYNLRVLTVCKQGCLLRKLRFPVKDFILI